MKDCKTCELEICPERCFNSHPGSVVALMKLLGHHGMDGVIIKENGELAKEKPFCP